MAYIKYKEIAKYFNFSKNISANDLPKYVLDYVFKGEKVLTCYKTRRDHGVFTDKKILLFDKKVSLDNTREIFTIPYSAISSVSVIFKPNSAEMSLFLDSGYPLRVKFIKMSGIDKKRLRLLYNIIQQIVSHQEIEIENMNILIENKISFD